ncbi:MAG: hypothetical protein R3F13_20675 [Prosthecobacter sp.]
MWKEFTREGIIAGRFSSRAGTISAATDKIFVEFTCNDKLLGTEIVVSSKPVLKFSVDGTAPIKRVTLVRNEKETTNSGEPQHQDLRATVHGMKPRRR